MAWLDSVLSDLEDMGIESFEDCCYTCGRSHARFEGLDNYVLRLESHTDVKTAQFRFDFTPEMLKQVKQYVQEHRHSVYLNEEDGVNLCSQHRVPDEEVQEGGPYKGLYNL